VRKRWNGDREFGDVFDAKPYPVEAIRDVNFYEMYWPKPRVAVNHLMQDALERPAKLHGFGGGE
jgi:hypothetical protein